MFRVSRRSPATLAAALALALLATAAGRAKAEEPPAPPVEVEQGAPTSVQIEVQVISASAQPGEVDPRLVTLQKRLRDFAFASYRIVSEKSVVLGLKSQEKLALPGNRTLEITPRRFEKAGKLRVHLHLRSDKNAKLIDADYAIEPGGDILVGGPRLEDGTLLVFIHHGAKAP
jgi:hypothetical protein